MTAEANAVPATKPYDTDKEPGMHKPLSLLTVAGGFILMVRQIYAESEPGAIPLLLIVLGSAWYLAARWRLGRRASNGTAAEDSARSVP